MPEQHPSQLQALRERAEHLLGQGAAGEEVHAVLSRLVSDAEANSEPALFAHRQLAELELERAPWRAALHLRQLQHAGVADDGVHALMGLCQAQLGNFRAAVAAYERALALAPDNPWYRHNLGHLLDIGLGDSVAGLRHLRAAQELEAAEDEITASLAHCLARLGELSEASTFAESAVELAPQKSEHRVLLDWVRGGARGEFGKRRPGAKGSGRRAGRAGRAGRTGVDEGGEGDVRGLLEQQMTSAGFAAGQIARAQALWDAFAEVGRVAGASPAVLAAAIEYAIAKHDCMSGVTQAQVARRYGVAARSISNRYGEIRRLSLLPEQR